MANPIDMQRSFALVGTGGSGKTSLAEMLLFQAGVTNRLGAIEDGTTSLDYEAEEIKRRGSISPALATYTWNKNYHYLLDIPGDSNFIGDIEILLQAVDSVVFNIDAVDGVRPLTRKLWEHVKKSTKPALVFINKLDRDRSNFDNAFNGLAKQLAMKTVLLQMPIIENENLIGYIDVLQSKAYKYDDDNKVSEITIPKDLEDEVTLYHDTAIENIAESDEELMEKYLEEGSLSDAEIASGLRKAVLASSIVPVLIGAALQNKGGAALLNTIESLLPSPLESAPFTDENGKTRSANDEGTACYIFKSIVDPFIGQLSLARIISGTISSDSNLKNSKTGDNERLSSINYLCGKTQTPCKESLGAGALIAIAKLKNTHTGDTLYDEKSPFIVATPQLAPQLMTFALAPKEKGDEDKVYAAMQKLLDEDITLKLARDEETSDTLLSGMGQLHIELSVEKIKRRYKIEILLKTPKVPYRETVKGKCQAHGRHKKQSGGRGQFGDCHIEMEGLPRGSGYVFEDGVVGGVIPKTYIPAIDKGIQESSARGYIAGYPVVDFKVRVYDGSYHDVDSSEMAFKIAGSLAFKAAMESLKPILLEPIVLITISVPDEFMGDVIGDLSSRRGKVLGSDSQAGITEIKGHVPMSEVLRYAPELRSMTGGQGLFTMEFDHYEESPPFITEKVVAEHQRILAENNK